MRNSVRFVVFVLALLALLGLMACNGGGPGPTPVTCQDPKATNYGQPGECKYVNSVRITNINTPVGVGDGGTIVCGSTVHVTVDYTTNQPAESPNGQLLTHVFLQSGDVVKAVGSVFPFKGNSGTGTADVDIRCPATFTTDSIVVTMERRNLGQLMETYVSEVRPYVLHWVLQ